MLLNPPARVSHFTVYFRIHDREGRQAGGDSAIAAGADTGTKRRRDPAPTPALREITARKASSESREDPSQQRYDDDYYQFNCDICDFQSNQESEFNNHIDWRHLIKYYTCKLKCLNFSDIITPHRDYVKISQIVSGKKGVIIYMLLKGRGSV